MGWIWEGQNLLTILVVLAVIYSVVGGNDPAIDWYESNREWREQRRKKKG